MTKRKTRFNLIREAKGLLISSGMLTRGPLDLTESDPCPQSHILENGDMGCSYTQ